MADKKTFYITTAIPYANGAPHIGHAYERIATDAFARFQRLDGKDVLFVTGMDEHGLKMQQTAAREGLTPLQLADRTAAQFEAMGEKLNAKADDIVRTTQPRHKETVREVWRRMAAKGDIYLSKYSGWYSVRDEAYYDEGELTQNAEGKKFAPTGTPVEWVEEESYFFKLSAYAEKLLAYYEAHPDFVTPEKYLNEIVAFVKRGLKDLSISRTTFDWGIKVPDDDRHVMYVWVDALTNYFTATDFLQGGPRAKFWPADAHVIGKDITRFHAIFWPAFLMSADLPLPKQIVVHGFLFNRGEKMSKSVGNVIDPNALADHYGVDALRYFFLREVPFGQDGNYSHEAIVQRINADLANDLGNLAQRSLSMIAKNCGGKVPAPGPRDEADSTLLARAYASVDFARNAMRDYLPHQALAEIWGVVGDANRYFAAQEPWKLGKTDPARRDAVLYVTAEILRVVALLCQAFIPEAAGKFLDLLGVAVDQRTLAHATPDHALVAGQNLPAPAPIFPRYVEAEEAK
ncbi:methionine--tRNA ligase [Rhodoblastus sphagnicola]|uniref:Methionine--tRNA ligase n=1 Tax=Rhodoblastus sphagnicola TaxID=333368 RepID=A0A2S6NA28_9HYPH|nr:methionine--tRNA ligase [Rhodoblastus sphagnicola]MBB4198860.1 methionyl-tRNA synthetase [Rhodoblastus sphagnicola]PPQ31478.1 methionine--tRNA ligase [Rhodoblastus sphagnicola]